MAKDKFYSIPQRLIKRMVKRRNNYKIHPLAKLLRYRHFKSTSFLITLIIALAGYINSEFYERDKDFVVNVMHKCKKLLGLNINKINIIGLKQLSENQIRSKLNIDINDSVVSLDIDKIKSDLESIPWVRHVVIQRILPDTLNIRVEENIPAAILQKNKRYYLINDRGQIIMESDNKHSQPLIILTGLKAEKNFSHMFKILLQFEDIHKNTKAASFISQRRWDIFLTSPNNKMLRVQLPQDDIERALQDLQKVMEDTSLDLANIKIIDVRQEGKVYLMYKNQPPESKNDILA